MVMHRLCAGFVLTTIRARLSLLDRNIGTSATFYTYITQKSHTKMLCIFLTGGGVRTYLTRNLYSYATATSAIEAM